MIRLSDPASDFSSTLDDCIAGIAPYMSLRGRITAGKLALVDSGHEYEVAARVGQLHAVGPFAGGDADCVLSDITKADLLKLYDQYLVPEGKVARRVYDSIMSAALEKCPFCGGIGTPRNLDHFLPKGHFPQFSVFPKNLIPSCRDCNMDGKADRFAVLPSEQVIHPYLEGDRFFVQQWIYASFVVDELGAEGRIEYFVQAPDDWSEVDQDRVRSHFQIFDLAKRYSVKAAEHMPTVGAQIGLIASKGLANTVIDEVLLSPGISKAPFINHWQRGFYQALREYLVPS